MRNHPAHNPIAEHEPQVRRVSRATVKVTETTSTVDASSRLPTRQLSRPLRRSWALRGPPSWKKRRNDVCRSLERALVVRNNPLGRLSHPSQGLRIAKKLPHDLC